MNHTTKSILNAIFCIAISLALTPTTAQQAYKCGNTYSNTPCPGAEPLSDSRTAEQKAQAAANAKRDAKLADSLEKDRLKAEAAAAKANVPAPAPKVAAAEPAQKPNTSKKKKKKEPEYFTAQAAGEGKPAKKATAKAPKKP